MQFLILIVALSLTLALVSSVLGRFFGSKSEPLGPTLHAWEAAFMFISIMLISLILIEAEAWIFTATAPSVFTNTWLIVFIFIPLAFVDLVIGFFATGWLRGMVRKIADPAQ